MAQIQVVNNVFGDLTKAFRDSLNTNDNDEKANPEILNGLLGRAQFQPNDQLPSPSLSPHLDPLECPEDGTESRKTDGDITNNTNSINGDYVNEEMDQHDLRKSSVSTGCALTDVDENMIEVPQCQNASRRSSHQRRASKSTEKEKILKLSPAQIQELTTSPNSIPVRVASPDPDPRAEINSQTLTTGQSTNQSRSSADVRGGKSENLHTKSSELRLQGRDRILDDLDAVSQTLLGHEKHKNHPEASRPRHLSRTVSTPPPIRRKQSSSRPNSFAAGPLLTQKGIRPVPAPLDLDSTKVGVKPLVPDPLPSPMPTSIPLPPLSFPTYLQLELSSDRPSPLYIHRSATSDFPYESNQVKLERLWSFISLPWELEQVLCFGAFACLDTWLYTFTILPLRFFKALWILLQSWGRNLSLEIQFFYSFMSAGIYRVWERARTRRTGSSVIAPKTSTQGEAQSQTAPSAISDSSGQHTPRMRTEKPTNREVEYTIPEADSKRRWSSFSKHRRTKSMPSGLLPDHKADLLKGALILLSCAILLCFDASRMYHGIRGQAAIKLYVIYSVLEVGDRLFSALGQDVLECLFSKEALERKPNGRSKVFRPLWLFGLALVYNVLHATALFYQVITLNVAVNSYSNALLTLLMSNQFVEIKSTVFKKFEKENLFQITCADIVERFQLWLMLTIIASRNIVETGGLSLTSSHPDLFSDSSNTQHHGPTILPKSFTVLPDWSSAIIGPFVLVLGSEVLVDWLKHQYITKFNNTKPAIYGRFLDVLTKDYYSNAFADPNLTRRLGLPIIPLSCLFIRASLQTYHMFLATHVPIPIPSTATSLSVSEVSPSTSPATTAALQHIDTIFRRALGRSSFGAGTDPTTNSASWLSAWRTWSTDDLIALLTMLVFFLLLYLVLLALKLLLGMCLLAYARNRYRGMKERERVHYHAEGRRMGIGAVVEVDEDKRRWIYADDEEGARRMREREVRGREKEAKAEGKADRFGPVNRYAMWGKRIW